jgi:hypothetical protein
MVQQYDKHKAIIKPHMAIWTSGSKQVVTLFHMFMGYTWYEYNLYCRKRSQRNDKNTKKTKSVKYHSGINLMYINYISYLLSN